MFVDILMMGIKLPNNYCFSLCVFFFLFSSLRSVRFSNFVNVCFIDLLAFYRKIRAHTHRPNPKRKFSCAHLSRLHMKLKLFSSCCLLKIGIRDYAARENIILNQIHNGVSRIA